MTFSTKLLIRDEKFVDDKTKLYQIIGFTIFITVHDINAWIMLFQQAVEIGVKN